MAWPDKLSVNQYSLAPRPLKDWLEEAARAGVAGVGIYRDFVEDMGYDKAIKFVRDVGLPVSIYQSIGYWSTGRYNRGAARTLKDDVRYMDQAVEMGAPVVNVSAGRLQQGEKDIRGARERFANGLAELVPYAAERNLKLAVEPLHPIFCPAISVLSSLGQALDMIDALGGHESLGINLDMYHTWWDPEIEAQLRRAQGRIWLVQVNDWSSILAAGDPMNRALMGEGSIDFDIFIEALGKTYDGWWDVETNNDELRALPLPQLFERFRSSFENTIGARLAAARA